MRSQRADATARRRVVLKQSGYVIPAPRLASRHPVRAL